MRSIKKFYFDPNNRIMIRILLISIAIIILYISTSNLNEIFVGAELLFNLLFQLSIGFCINFIFYVTQVYIPELKNRNSIYNNGIKLFIEEIVVSMRRPFSILVEENSPDIDIFNISNDDNIKLNNLILENIKITSQPTEISKLIFESFSSIECSIDRLFVCFGNYISNELRFVIQKFYKCCIYKENYFLLTGEKNGRKEIELNPKEYLDLCTEIIEVYNKCI